MLRRAEFLLLFGCLSWLSDATVLAQKSFQYRVLIAVQNPTGIESNGNEVIAPQFSLQIADAANNNFGASQVPPIITGWGTAQPYQLESLPNSGTALVNNEDGTASLINYANQSVSTATLTAPGVPTRGGLLTQDTSYAFFASNETGTLIVLDRAANTQTSLSVPGVMNVSMAPGGQTVLVFAHNSNMVYYLRKLSSTDGVAYANGNWPTDAQDCEPYTQPAFCLLRLNSPGGNAQSFANSNFDHPVKAVVDPSSAVMYVVDGGPEAGGSVAIGSTAGITVLPTPSLAFTDGLQQGSLSATLPRYTVGSASNPGGADNAIIGPNSMLYVAGQQRLHSGLWAGQLTTIDLTTGTVHAPQPMADGYPARMVFADNNTLWIGSLRCNTGANQYQSAQSSSARGGCLTVVNTGGQTPSVAYVEPLLCPVDSTTTCSSGQSGSPFYGTAQGAPGDVTGIAPISGQGKVYYVENGQVHIRSTQSPYNIIPNTGVSVLGFATDVVFMDASGNTDNTSLSTTH